MPKTCLIVPTFSKESNKIIEQLISKVNVQSIKEVDVIVVNNNQFALHVTTILSK